MERSQKLIKTFSLAFGILFLFIGAVMIIVSVGVNVRIIGCQPVEARVAEVIETHSKPRKDYEIIYYTPVYEYYDGGEICTYKSSVSTSAPVEIGTETTLYISGNGIVYERRGTLSTLLAGIFFAAIGYLFAFVKVKKLGTKSIETEDGTL